MQEIDTPDQYEQLLKCERSLSMDVEYTENFPAIQREELENLQHQLKFFWVAERSTGQL